MSMQAILISASQQVLTHRYWWVWKNGLYRKLSFPIFLWRKYSQEFSWSALLSRSHRQIFFPRSPSDMETCTTLCKQIHLLSKPNMLFLHHIFHRRGSEVNPSNSEITQTAGFGSVRGLATHERCIKLTELHHWSLKVGLSQGMQLHPHDGRQLRGDGKTSELREYCKEWPSVIKASWSYLSARRAWCNLWF